MEPVNKNDADGFDVGDIVHVSRRGKRGTFTAHYQRDGHRRKSLRTTNETLARKRASQLYVKIMTQTDAIVPKPLKLKEAVERYMQNCVAEGRAPKTIVKYRAELERFIAFLTEHGINTPDKITPLLFDDYRSQRRSKDGLAARTAWNHAVILKQWLRFLLHRQVIANNPLAGIPLRKPPCPKHPAATAEEVADHRHCPS